MYVLARAYTHMRRLINMRYLQSEGDNYGRDGNSFRCASTLYEQCGHVLTQDGLMIENMHDVPWLRPDQLGPETTAVMSVVCSTIRRDHPKLPIGLQILSSANKEALAVAMAAGIID